MNEIPQQRQQRLLQYFIHSCRLPYVIYYFIFGLIIFCFFTSLLFIMFIIGGRWWYVVVVVGADSWWQVVVGGPWRPGGDRCQFPRTDFGPFRISSHLPTPLGPLKLRLFGGNLSQWRIYFRASAYCLQQKHPQNKRVIYFALYVPTA